MSKREPALSRLGLGASRMGSFNNPQPLSASVRLVRRAIELGVTTIDTSNIYGQGDSERAIGRALAGGLRDQAFIVTKGGRHFSGKAQALRWLKPLIRPMLRARGQGGAVTARRGEVMGFDWSEPALISSLEGSLRRLQTDRVDGFILHSPPVEVIGPAAEQALARILASGKARYVGISCDDAAAVEAALRLPMLGMLELPINLITMASAQADAIAARGIIVLVREVIRLRSDLAPSAAVAAALANPVTSTALIGTTREAHLAAIAMDLA